MTRDEICATLKDIVTRLQRIEDAKQASGKRRGTLNQCRGYAVEIGLPATTGEEFFDKMESQDWAKGKAQVPIKDWRATMRVWKSQNWLNTNSNTMGGM